MKGFKVLLYEDMHEAGKALLREKAEISYATSYEEASLIKEASDMDAIIIRANGKVTRKLMESAPRLKVVGRHGVGVENIDLEGATDKGVWVVNTPDANDISVAEHFFGLALMLSKMLKKGDQALREGRWEARYQYIGNELHGKTLGILTLIGDVLKGMAPIWIAIQWRLPDHWIAIAGLSPFLGHIFPIFLGFKGGKGVATALGIYLVISPVAVMIEFLLFAWLVWKWRFISLGSICCATTMPILIAFFRTDSRAYFILSVFIGTLILFRHQSNISRLLQGMENKWKA